MSGITETSATPLTLLQALYVIIFIFIVIVTWLCILLFEKTKQRGISFRAFQLQSFISITSFSIALLLYLKPFLINILPKVNKTDPEIVYNICLLLLVMLISPITTFILSKLVEEIINRYDQKASALGLFESINALKKPGQEINKTDKETVDRALKILFKHSEFPVILNYVKAIDEILSKRISENNFEEVFDKVVSVLLKKRKNKEDNLSKINLCLSTDDKLSDITSPEFGMTFLFSEHQRLWSNSFDANYCLPNNTAYFNFEDSPSADKLNSILGITIVDCINRICNNHSVNFNCNGTTIYNHDSPPRVIRVIFSRPEELVKSAKGLLPISGTKKINRMLDLWIDIDELENMKVESWMNQSTPSPADQTKFFPWQERFEAFKDKESQDTLEKIIVMFLKENSLGSNSWRDLASRYETFGVNSPAKKRRDLLCLAIGDECAVVGRSEQLSWECYAEPLTAAKCITVFLSLLPVVMMAMHYKKLLSYPLIVEYSRKRLSNITDEHEKNEIVEDIRKFVRG